MTDTREDLAGVVLAAGAGRRLAPLTSVLPKALCPVNGIPLVTSAVRRLEQETSAIAVNIHHGAEHFEGVLGPEVHRSFEPGVARGTAGGLGLLRPWVDGRDVLVTNADAWFGPSLDLTHFVAGWDRERTRLLCVDLGRPADFGTLRYCGVALIPWITVNEFSDAPAGLYEVSWHRDFVEGRLDLVASPDIDVIDCGTPADYLRANLRASGGRSVTMGASVADGAVVLRSVVWPGAVVEATDVLVDAVRAGPLTVLVR